MYREVKIRVLQIQWCCPVAAIALVVSNLKWGTCKNRFNWDRSIISLQDPFYFFGATKCECRSLDLGCRYELSPLCPEGIWLPLTWSSPVEGVQDWNRGCRQLWDEIQAKTVPDDTRDGWIILESSPYNAPAIQRRSYLQFPPTLFPSFRRIRGGRGLVRGPLGLNRSNITSFVPSDPPEPTADRNHRSEEHFP
jgi:hypothetical protein